MEAQDTHSHDNGHEPAASNAPAAVTFAFLMPLSWLFIRSSGLKLGSSLLLQVLLLGACSVWLGLVSKVVPEPYLDEVFHIPQAQKYCEGRFRDWDDKITTPPGLLRAVSAASLLALSYLSLLCRQKIGNQRQEKQSTERIKALNSYAAHTATNIALFPLLFFFSGLYYTDVLSTTTVILAFLHHLSRVEKQTSSILSDFTAIALGLATLFMRQTNVFWIVVFMGGLEAVHAVKSLRPKATTRPLNATIWAQIQYSISRYSSGAVHDLSLAQAWPDDAVITILSLAIAGICNPLPILRQIWPYITVLLAFAGFVFWNGSVVLGALFVGAFAKMLYIWPFFAFFSLPLIVPSVLPGVSWVYQALLGNKAETGNGSSKASPAGSTVKQHQYRSTYEPLFIFKRFVWLVYTLSVALISFAIVRYNTIIHPFTLADNRHYMFYVFRYTIRRANWIRYFLVLPYTVSRWLVWATFAGCYGRDYGFSTNSSCPSSIPQAEEDSFSNHPVWISRQEMAGTKSPTLQKLVQKSQSTPTKSPSHAQPTDKPQSVSTSTGLIFLLATSLSLVTAPLVEPRYFIIPWVMWRLLLPAVPPHTHGEWSQDAGSRAALGGELGKLLAKINGHGIALILETVWFIAINVVTGYIFLTKPYQWKATDGSLLDDGRWQRFMW